MRSIHKSIVKPGKILTHYAKRNKSGILSNIIFPFSKINTSAIEYSS